MTVYQLVSYLLAAGLLVVFIVWMIRMAAAVAGGPL